MLNKILIRNFALIDSIEIVFDEKLNIITGETGAGKSIILGALSLLLGHRAESKYFFNQQKKCIIEGQFINVSNTIKDFLILNDLDVDVETILRREISIDGKSRSFINDTPVNLSILKIIGEKLIDIHSQHATLELNDLDFQLGVLDSLAKQTNLVSEFQQNFNQYKSILKKLDELKKSKEKSVSEIDYLQYLFDELEEANVKINEQNDLENELSVLSNAEEIKKSLTSAEFLFDAQEQSILTLTKTVHQIIQQSEKYLPQAEEISNRINSCYIELKDISNEISTLQNNIFYDENKINFINERLTILYQLNKKHHTINADELINVKQTISEKLSNFLISDDEISHLENELKRYEHIINVQAKEISINREKIIPIVENLIVDLLQTMGLKSAAFKISIKAINEIQKSGIDKVEFLFSANGSQNLNSISKVASGGEISRLMLALKSIIAKYNALPTIIFDEIDTGISGEIAQKVGKILSSLSQNLQVISITHLPQIAVQGQTHLFVYKLENQNLTQTKIKKLTPDEREIEIAKMLSGDNYTDAALLNARDLLKQ